MFSCILTKNSVGDNQGLLCTIKYMQPCRRKYPNTDSTRIRTPSIFHKPYILKKNVNDKNIHNYIISLFKYFYFLII